MERESERTEWRSQKETVSYVLITEIWFDLLIKNAQPNNEKAFDTEAVVSFVKAIVVLKKRHLMEN